MYDNVSYVLSFGDKWFAHRCIHPLQMPHYEGVEGLVIRCNWYLSLAYTFFIIICYFALLCANHTCRKKKHLHCWQNPGWAIDISLLRTGKLFLPENVQPLNRVTFLCTFNDSGFVALHCSHVLRYLETVKLVVTHFVIGSCYSKKHLFKYSKSQLTSITKINENMETAFKSEAYNRHCCQI